MSIPNQQRRLDKLKQLLADLLANKHVQNRTLETWLSAEQYAQLFDNWEEHKAEYRDLEKPDVIKEYESKLKVALMLENRAKALHRKGKHEGVKKLSSKAESEFEDTLEYLQDIIQADPSLHVWFDRDLDFNAGAMIGTDSASMPRIVTSRSTARLGNGILSGKQSKRDVKIAVIESAIAELEQEETNVQVDTDKLRAKLTKLKATTN